MKPIIMFKDFNWKYRASQDLVLKNINLTIHEGEFVGIMGPTGAGKSTLCHCMNGLIPLRTRGWIKGTVEIFGQNTRNAKMTELGQKIGLIFQDPETQFIMMTVEDEIALGLETLGLSRSEIKERIKWALKLVGLEGHEQKSPDELSGGQKQRVAIASIMAMRPRILIFDEPTSDLDPNSKFQIFQLLEIIRKKFGLTIILVSHETKKILQFCDRILLLKDGKIEFDGKPSNFLQNVELLESAGICLPFELPDILSAVSKKQMKAIPPRFDKKPIIEVKNLSFTYPNMTKALKDVSLTIYQGDFIAIIGKNGSGKTTLIKHFNGLLKPQKGSVFLKGKSITKYSIPEIARTIGFCYQNPDHQLFKNTIKEEIEFSLRNMKFSNDIIEKRYNDIVNLLDLKKFEKIYASTLYLSKGIRQRLALASVLVLEPEILLIDEPATGQDFYLIKSFMNILENLNKQNRTIIIVTHNPYIISYYSKEVVILKDGKIRAKMPTLDFLKNSEMQKHACFTP
ncbi:MAG: ABC transporter ATP-binding protein [Promethearchaeota archaeon]